MHVVNHGMKPCSMSQLMINKEPKHAEYSSRQALRQVGYRADRRRHRQHPSGDAAEKNDAALPVRPEAMHQIQPRTGQKMTRTQLIERGRQIFNHETFAGNGRTCATCHPASNNFTIDPQYVAKLRRDDPLFVAETNPDLAAPRELPPAPQPCPDHGQYRRLRHSRRAAQRAARPGVRPVDHAQTRTSR